MRAKVSAREQAIALRRRGMSYREIRERIPVAKSTLSLWFREVELSMRQKQRLTEKKRAAQLRGGESRRRQRIEGTNVIVESAIQDVHLLTANEKWLVGVILYWAEGSKEKPGAWGSQVQFGNSDPRMALLFKRWLLEVIKIDSSEIKYEIYIHENHKHRLDAVRNYWAEKLCIGIRDLNHIYFKRHKPGSNRKNQGNEYYGLVRLYVRSSSALNRKISGWVEGVVRNWGIV